MKLAFCTTHEGMKPQAPKQTRVLVQHVTLGPVEGLLEAEGYGNVYIRIPDYLKDQADFIPLLTRVALSIDPFASYLVCSANSVTFLS